MDPKPKIKEASIKKQIDNVFKVKSKSVENNNMFDSHIDDCENDFSSSS